MAIDTIKSSAVLDGAIATADIADDAVTGAKLANDINIAGDLTVTGNDINTAGSMLLRPAGTEIVNINNTGDVIVKGQGSSRAALILRAGSNTANSQIRLGDQAADDVGRIMYNHSDDTMIFQTAGSERFRVSASGIHIGGTGAANALDDYEEGTWTPTVTVAGSGMSFSTQSGTYVKIGNICRAQFYLHASGGTMAGQGLKFGTLPFTPTGTHYTVGFGYNNASGSAIAHPIPIVFPGDTNIWYYVQNSTGVAQVTGSTLGNNLSQLWTVVYQTT